MDLQQIAMKKNSKHDMRIWEIIQICNKMLTYEFTLQDINDFLQKLNYDTKIQIKKFHNAKFSELSSIFTNEEKTEHYCRVLNYFIYKGYYTYMNCNFFKFKILMNSVFEESVVQIAFHDLIRKLNTDTDCLLEKVKEKIVPDLMTHAARF